MKKLVAIAASVAIFAACPATADEPAAPGSAPKLLRVGVIGLDTSHSIAFTQLFNEPNARAELAGFRVVAAYPQGSRDIQASVSRVPEYTQKMQSMGIEIVDSIDALLEKVDAVLLESNDGRVHLEQSIPVLRSGKPLFIDKPVAGSLEEALVIYGLAKHYNVPVFSSSALRYTQGAQAIRDGKIGQVLGADAYSPASFEPTHPDLFWYGIHGVETLFTVMGAGCESVVRVHTADADVVVGTWADGRIGTFRGTRRGAHAYGGTAFGAHWVEPIGGFKGYEPLVAAIAEFFRSGRAPVDPAETIEIYAFMAAADESKRLGGVPVSIKQVMEQAQKQAQVRLQSIAAP